MSIDTWRLLMDYEPAWFEKQGMTKREALIAPGAARNPFLMKLYFGDKYADIFKRYQELKDSSEKTPPAP